MASNLGTSSHSLRSLSLGEVSCCAMWVSRGEAHVVRAQGLPTAMYTTLAVDPFF